MRYQLVKKRFVGSLFDRSPIEQVCTKEDIARWLRERVKSGDLKLIFEEYATVYTRKQFNMFLRRVHAAVLFLSDATYGSENLPKHLDAVHIIDAVVDVVVDTVGT